MALIAAQQLEKRYKRSNGVVHALDNVSLTIEPGEFVAVQGPSGCGKTTLLLAVGGLQMPDSGQVVVDGQDMYALSPEARAAFRAKTIGFVFQQFHLIPYFTVLENVLAPAMALQLPDAQARAEELIAHFNLTDRVDHLPADLSTGERQRTALARALLNHPKLLLADEPTGNLDTQNAEIVFKYLCEFVSQGGSVMLVTHDPRSTQYASRTLPMEGGKLLAFK